MLACRQACPLQAGAFQQRSAARQLMAASTVLWTPLQARALQQLLPAAPLAELHPVSFALPQTIVSLPALSRPLCMQLSFEAPVQPVPSDLTSLKLVTAALPIISTACQTCHKSIFFALQKN